MRFHARQSLPLISVAVCNVGRQPSDLHSKVAHLLSVCRAERDGYSVFVYDHRLDWKITNSSLQTLVTKVLHLYKDLEFLFLL